MDPPSEGVDGGSDPPSAFGLRAQQGTGDPTDDMLAMQRVEQRESGGAQPPDEGPADIYPTGSGITAPTAPEPLDTTPSRFGLRKKSNSEEVLVLLFTRFPLMSLNGPSILELKYPLYY